MIRFLVVKTIQIGAKMKGTIEKEGFLDKRFIHEFMDLINGNKIFFNKPELISLYNLICTFKDRLITSVNYLNKHSERPNNEENFIIFLVFACMIYDGFNKMYESLLHEIPPYKGEKKYFKDVKNFKEYFFTDETCPTDDVFFEYLRAMAFAHPYEVVRKGRPFIKDKEKHYCPWVVINNIFNFDDIKDSVGIRIYTSIDQDEITTLTFSFNNLKRYIKSIYNTFPRFIKWARNIIDEQNEEWKKIKVNRKQDNIALLKEVRNILERRFADTYSIDKILSYLTCEITDVKNRLNIEIFRRKISSSISKICDAVDDLNYEAIEDVLSFIYETPEKMHKGAGYQLEKIYSYLHERSETINKTSDEYWGLQQAYLFSQGFAKKWVTINVQTMQYDEIKLLVTVACYLEKEEQEKRKVKI